MWWVTQVRLITSLRLLAKSFLTWMLLANFAARTHYWLRFNLSTIQVSSELLPSWLAPRHVLGVSSHVQDLTFPLIYSIYLLLAHFSNLSSSLWIAAQPYGLSTTSPSFSVICDSGSFLIHILQYLLLVNLVQHFHIWLGISISLPYHSHFKVVLTSLISLLANVLFVQLLSLDIYLPVSPQFLGKVPWS